MYTINLVTARITRSCINPYQLVDVDECFEKLHQCAVGDCVNIPGDYECICPQGYINSINERHSCVEGK